MPINARVLDNPRSDRVRRVADLSGAKVRARTGRFLIEGPQSVREAVTWRPDVVQDIYVEVTAGLGQTHVASDTLQHIVDLSQDSTIYVHQATETVMRLLSRDSQGILAVGNSAAMSRQVQDLAIAQNATVAAFWQVRDPGNAGTVIRAADAAGCAAVVFVDDCVDALNPKVIRATAGSLFHIPVVRMDTEALFAWAAGLGLDVLAADIHGTREHPPIPFTALLNDTAAMQRGKVMLFGNEARGLPAEVVARAEHSVAIPLYGKAESLNLAGSAAVILMGLAMSSHIGRM